MGNEYYCIYLIIVLYMLMVMSITVFTLIIVLYIC